jgi:uncharacterized Zn finger protein
MYGIHRYCPRCGGHRLFKLHGKNVLVICAGCGLVIEEPEPVPPSFDPTTDLEIVLRRQRWRAELPVCASPQTPAKRS